MELKQCPRQGTPYLIADSKKKGKRTILKARCKQWDCEYCAPINKSQHINRIANGLYFQWTENIEMQFVTITCHENWRGQDASIKNWRKNKDKLLARVRRRYNVDTSSACEYVYLCEYHQDETLHIHGIFCGDFGTRWWKDNARECGLGFMAESSRLSDIFQAINYITKYITKEVGKGQFTKGFRRISYSQGFKPLAHLESDDEWSILARNESIESAIMQGLAKGLDVQFSGKNWTYDDF